MIFAHLYNYTSNTLKKYEEKGREEGLEKGREEGLEKGREEGEKKKALAIARSMLEEKLPIKQISKLTGLSEAKTLTLEKK